MGGADFLSSGNESDEEEKKEVPKGHTGVRVFRPNLTAPQRAHFAEDSGNSASNHHVNQLLQKEFEDHLANPNVKPVQTESDSDTAPCPAVVDEKEETDEEKKSRKIQSIEDSAKLASSEDEALPSQSRVQSAKLRSSANANNTAKHSEFKEAERPSDEESSEDDQWFAQQRRTARTGRPQTATVTQSNTAVAERKR